MRRLATALLNLGLLAAACSGTDEAAPTATATSPTTTAAPAPAPTTSVPPPATTAAPTPTATSTTAAAAAAASEDEQKAEADGGAEPADPLGAAVAEWMERTGAPGLVLAVTQGGAKPATFAWGLSDIATAAPMTVDHHVRIGSVTKPVTAAVVL